MLDGSTDCSVAEAHDLSRQHEDVRLFTLSHNHGKGGATLVAMRAALEEGYSHALVADADGQHPADRIASFMEISTRHPEAMILGVPGVWTRCSFGARQGTPDRKLVRQPRNPLGRRPRFAFRLSSLPAQTRRPHHGIHPNGATIRLRYRARGEALWAGVRPINQSVPVHYPPRSAGGVSHFNIRPTTCCLQERIHGCVF